MHAYIHTHRHTNVYTFTALYGSFPVLAALLMNTAHNSAALVNSTPPALVSYSGVWCPISDDPSYEYVPTHSHLQRLWSVGWQHDWEWWVWKAVEGARKQRIHSVRMTGLWDLQNMKGECLSFDAYISKVKVNLRLWLCTTPRRCKALRIL